MKLTFVFIIWLLTAVSGKSQNGSIVEKTQLTLPDSVIEYIKLQDVELFSNLGNINFYRIVYLSDGLKVIGYLSEPKKPGKYPCIIYNRGGTFDNSKLNMYSVALNLGRFVNWGYVVLASQYRGNDGGEGKEEYGGSDVNDILNLITTFSFLSNADTSRIGIYGSSRGGMMTYLTLKKSCRLKAAVVNSGITDLPGNLKGKDSIGFERLYRNIVPNYLSNKQEVLKERSVLYWPDQLCKTTPLLIFHGSADRNAAPSGTIELVKELENLKHPVRLILFEGGQHNLLAFSKEMLIETKKIFDDYVRDAKKWPGLEAK